MFAYCNNNPVVMKDSFGTNAQYISIMEEYFRISELLKNGPGCGYDLKDLYNLRQAAAEFELVTHDQMKQAGFGDLSVREIYEINLVLMNNQIDTGDLISHFLAQCAYESNYGKWLTELGDESYFANSAYGYKYRGAGYIHITWDYNYEAFSNAIGDPFIYSLGADYVAENYAWAASGWWWSHNNMNEKILNGYSVDQVSLTVLGGNNGTLGARAGIYQRYRGIFG